MTEVELSLECRTLLYRFEPCDAFLQWHFGEVPVYLSFILNIKVSQLQAEGKYSTKLYNLKKNYLKKGLSLFLV